MDACCYTAVVQAAVLIVRDGDRGMNSTVAAANKFLASEFTRWTKNEEELEGDHGSGHADADEAEDPEDPEEPTDG